MRTDKQYAHVQRLLDGMGLNTVCADANCPNRLECWNSGTATIMILGETCTRNCRFCAVETGQPARPETDEPNRVVAAASELGLQHLVLTSVTRDDLPDGGAGIFAECILEMRKALPNTTVEVLIPDFKGDESRLEKVLRAGPDVLNHNIETVRRLQKKIRPHASYACSMDVLRRAYEWDAPIAVKSGIMVGLGETDQEIFDTLEDLYNAGCRLLTIGQYLAPSNEHWPVDRYVEPRKFNDYAKRARAIGFLGVESAPLVRSSYKAAEMLNKVSEGK